MANKVVRDGRVAVIYSPGFGSGWYSWNTEFPDCLFNPRIVEAIESNKPVGPIAEELYGEKFYIGSNARSLEIEWVPEGSRFEIDEYDGFESVRILNPNDGFIA